MKHYSHVDNKKIFLDTKLDKLFKHKKKGFSYSYFNLNSIIKKIIFYN